ncbi:MAG: type II CAAX prenyl endopeptidase Rce1 family protein [Anaeromyxobacteraceae bacterium]
MDAPPPPGFDAPSPRGSDALAPRDGAAHSDDAAPRPPPATPRLRGGVFFAIVLALFVVPGQLAQAASPILGLAWSEICALLLPAVVAAAGSNLRPRAALLLARRPTAAQAGLAVAVSLAAFGVAVPLAALWSLALPERLLRTFDVSRIFEAPPLTRYSLALLAATVAPLCEEAAFRGWILTALRTRHSVRDAIALSTVLFAVMHLDPVRLPALLVLGAVFGWLAWRSGSLWPSIIAHATNNALVGAIALSQAGTAPDVAERAAPLQALAVLLAAGVLLWGALSAYRRVTPEPPPLAEALVPRDPADLDPRYDARRLGPRLQAAIALALAALVALAAAGLLRHRSTTVRHSRPPRGAETAGTFPE